MTIIDKIYFSRVNPNATIPSKREEDGCYDVYACFNEDFILIYPNTIKAIPTGIASAFDPKYRFDIRERGSTGSRGLSVRAGQIDSGFRGEWFILINNTTNKPIYIAKSSAMSWLNEISEFVTIYPYNKAICQAAFELVPPVTIEEIPYDKLMNIKSERGKGKLGASGK